MTSLSDALNKPSADTLQGLCDAMNSPDPPSWVPELRRLLKIWRDTGPNLVAMLARDAALNQKLRENFSVLWWPTQSGRSYMIFSPHPDPLDPAGEARAIFITITLSPDWDKLRGPCLRPQCGKYFLRSTEKKEKRYCSRDCASLHGAQI